jgi:hypothetical protein
MSKLKFGYLCICEARVCHIDFAEDSGMLGCYTLSIGKYLTTIYRIVVN